MIGYFSTVPFISYVILFLIIIFQSKIFLGFIFHGIRDDESHVTSNIYYPTIINKNNIDQNNEVWKGIIKLIKESNI